ncbi:hypothetical protein [Agrococcus carbonis]|uniref:Capsular polysaccharide biosynthesis protein n=1 Tax=Agrococcus carbonis TaxID=684552 RepID=A0A1H1LCG1_9MICO|nr:hypothetical protein [Agrococcus carbonis]SDR72002.1 hypothetical protein SAMN04489719_0522 [Agrococcus carbonis]
MVRDVIRVLVRRWYVVLLGLLLTAGLAYGAVAATPPEFKSRALVLLLPSADAVEEIGNPLLALSGLEQPASLVVAQIMSNPEREAVERRSATADYFVALDSSVRGPVILVEVNDVTAAQSLATLEYLKGRISDELARLQAEVDAPDDSIIRSMELTTDVTATEDLSTTIRNAIAAVAVGLAATGFLAFGVDGLITRRSAREPALPRAEGAANDLSGDRAGRVPAVPKEPADAAPAQQDEEAAQAPEPSPARTGRAR